MLAAAGLSIVRARNVPAALDALRTHSAQVVVADAEHARALVDALRRDARRATMHVVLAAALESAH